MKLVLSKRFRADLRQEYKFLKRKNPDAAQAVRGRIIRSIQRLRNYPELGRAWRLEGCRELLIAGQPYLVIYKLTADSVIVASLFHTSRELPHVH